MKTFMLIGVRDRKAHTVCTVQADDINHAAMKLGGANKPGFIQGVPFEEAFPTNEYRMFLPSIGTGTVVAAAATQLEDDPVGDDRFSGSRFKENFTAFFLGQIVNIV